MPLAPAKVTGGFFILYSLDINLKRGKFKQALRVCLNFAQVNFANCFRGYFSDFMRRIAGYLTNKIGKTDRKQTQKNLIEYYFIGKFKQALRLHVFCFRTLLLPLLR